MQLSPLVQAFVLHFGEMGSRWGINRTVGQIYALLFVNERPLNADDIAEMLHFSRSNVSMGLKELQSWRLVRLQHLPDDRREYFTTPDDVWQIFRTLIDERRRREVDPTLSMLRDALMVTPTTDQDRYAQTRLTQMHELIELTTTWLDDVQKLDESTLRQLMKLATPDALLLHRIQFAANISFHILFPPSRSRWAGCCCSSSCASTPPGRKWMDGLRFLGEGVRADLCAGRGERHHHELSVRHQLAGLHANRGQHRRAAAGL
jgi:DNA-binding transcriptional regulator GbsR (MarR family)